MPSGSTGTKTVVLVGIKILGNDGHGMLINDQDLPEEAGDPDAGRRSHRPWRARTPRWRCELVGSQIGTNAAGNGFGALDRDGVRINEGGLGELRRHQHDDARRATAARLELDGAGDGDAKFDVTGSVVAHDGNST